jgi:hypothetical protein
MHTAAAYKSIELMFQLNRLGDFATTKQRLPKAD